MWFFENKRQTTQEAFDDTPSQRSSASPVKTEVIAESINDAVEADFWDVDKTPIS